MSRVRRWSMAALAVPALTLAACSTSSTSASTSAQTTPPTTAPTTASTTTPTTPPATATAVAIAPIPAGDRSPTGTAGSQPTVVVPTTAAPTQLESSDLIMGSGPTAKAGDSVTVQYVLASYSSHQVVQSSWTGSPFTFTLDATPEMVITGWDQGVAGMQVGGRRELIIPPALGYGSSPRGPGIVANDTLVFIVDLLKIN